MMWGHYDQFSWWWWVVMPLGMVAFWALLAWVIVTLARADRATAPPAPEAERILAERYACGEIDAEEYRAKLADRRGTAAPVGGRST